MAVLRCPPPHLMLQGPFSYTRMPTCTLALTLAHCMHPTDAGPAHARCSRGSGERGQGGGVLPQGTHPQGRFVRVVVHASDHFRIRASLSSK